MFIAFGTQVRKLGRHGLLAGLFLGTLAAAPARAAKAPAAPEARDTLGFRGIFEDTSFDRASRVLLEVLETGDTVHVSLGRPFNLRLPADSVWNLCFSGNGKPAPAAPLPADTAAPTDSTSPADSTSRAAADTTVVKSAAAGADTAGRDATASAEPPRIEKCFELQYVGSDSVFSADIGEGPATVIVEPALPAAGSTERSAEDTVSGEADAGPYRPEDAVQLKKVMVRVQRVPKRSLGKSTVSAKLIKRMPGLAEADVIRSIQALPGVVASSDFSTKIYVRGGGSDQNLILLDRAVVYSPVHFFGLFSTFLVEAIDDVTFYKGGFPPEYGNRLSSVLDIKSRTGGDTADSWFKGSSVKISTFASQAHTEGHQGNFRWLLAARRTYIDQMLDFLRSLDATELDLPYAFYDVQGSGNYDIGGGDNMLFSFYQGRDELEFGVFEVDWGNTVIPMNLTLRVSDAWTSRSTASYSLFSQSFGLKNIFRLYNRIATWNYTQAFEYTGLESHRLSLGGDFNWMETIFTNEQMVAKLKLSDRTGFFLNNLFAQDRWTLGQSEVTTGVRLSMSSTLERPYLEPRLSLKYRLPGNQGLDFHTGYYAQYVNSINFQDQENLNEFYYPAKEVKFRTVNPTTSVLFSAGYGADKVLGQWDFTLEGYYKTLNHLLVFAPDELPDSLSNRVDLTLGDYMKEANGYSFGYEVSLRRPEGTLFGGISYSNGTSVIREDNSPDAYFPRWHQPHSLKADLAINWRGKDGIWNTRKRGRFFRSSTSLKYASGLPYTQEIGYLPAHLLDQSPGRGAGGPNPEFQGDLNTIRGNRNAAFVPAYLRWDAKLIDVGKEGKWNFSWTILNLLNHKNIFFFTYDRQSNPPVRQEITQFPFFPLLVNYEYTF